MKSIVRSLPAIALIAASLLGANPTARAAEYKLTGDNTTIKFVGSKKDGKHEGKFPKLTGTLNLSDDLAKSQVNVTIDVPAMTTDNAKLTAHLKSPDFFDAKRFPEAKFVSTSIKQEKDGHVVTGDLTLHGKTKSLSFPAKVAEANGTTTVSCQFEINRHDWDISFGKGNVNDTVQLSIEVAGKRK